ncbi:hypothetical protein JCM16303_006853 [Sporobolomyces ruberrimus]
MRTTAFWITAASLFSASIAATVPTAQKPFEMASSSTPSLTDLLTRSKHSRLFYDYLRESTSVSTRLANPLESTTILAPVNSAIVSLERKPHQGPPEPVGGNVEGYSGSREDEQARADYLENWIKRHLVNGRVNLEDQTKEYETLQEGAKVTIVKREGHELYTVMPGNIEVVEIEEANHPFPTLLGANLC